MPLCSTLLDAVKAAIDRRAPLLDRLHAEGTDCYRLFHGVADGEPGLSIDRYGSLLLLQTFRAPLSHDDAELLGRTTNDRLGLDLPFACNHRGDGAPAAQPHAPGPAALLEHECREAHTGFLIVARHRGQDPWLFLDLRVGRRLVRELAPGRAVLNLFAYTCGVGVVAAAANARSVLNVDFAASALEIGRRNAARNGIDPQRFHLLHSDCIPVLRQLAGLPVQRRGKQFRYPKVAQQPFDLVVLDPPRWAKGPFGAVDVVRDYASLFKPCLLTLADGGVVLATNHVPEVSASEFANQLERCARKAGRPLRSLELFAPDEDFPSPDGQPPLKIALCRV